MKILWITNILFPEVCKILGLEEPVIGGWMYSSAKALVKNDPTITLAVATVYKGDVVKKYTVDNITYYLLPQKAKGYKYDLKLEAYWNNIKNDYNPDVVHIHGSELAHGLAYINACGKKNVVLSIQGLTSKVSANFFNSITISELRYNIVSYLILSFQRHKYKKSSKLENIYFNSIDHVIGRTTWDKAYIYHLNSNVKYHFCNELLRSEFYKGKKWEYNSCEKHSIFLSQGSYPIKGLHQVLKALPFVLSKYPDTKLYIAGDNPLNRGSLKSKFKYLGYGDYIQSLIDRLSLNKCVFFLNPLTADKVRKQLLKSNVFICPSSIENSPNSLGEAQLLGVPCIGAFVGGIPDMIEDKKTGFLYPFEEIEMLGLYICDVFENKMTHELSINETISAKHRHDRNKNIMDLSEVYNKILKTL